MDKWSRWTLCFCLGFLYFGVPACGDSKGKEATPDGAGVISEQPAGPDQGGEPDPRPGARPEPSPADSRTPIPDRGDPPSPDRTAPAPDRRTPAPDRRAPPPPPDRRAPPPPPPVACKSEGGTAPVAAPKFVRQIKYTGTSWYGSPAIVDLDKDGKKEIIATFYAIYVWDANGKTLATVKQGTHHQGRIYTPGVVADLDGDGVYEIVVGGSRCSVAAYEYRNRALTIKKGWPVKACNVRESSVEVRGMAAADLDGDGKIEIVVSTTQNGQGAQIWAFRADGKLYQPKGLSAWKAWPRYNKATGKGNDGDANGCGHGGYGAYGLNVAIGNIDSDPQLEIIATYDNHHIQAFNHDGTAILAAPFFKNRSSKCKGSRMSWGQFIRWIDPVIEANHYNKHSGEWPHPKNQIWLQWTASPPVIADVNGNGRNEVIGIPNAEKNEPYVTQFYAMMVLEGNVDPSRSARRLKGWEQLYRGGAPLKRPQGYYPPLGIPAPTVVHISGDKRPELLAPMNDGFIHAVSADGKPLWKYDFRHGRPLMYASEVVVADLNKDGRPELLFTTYGAPKDDKAGWLVVLDANGKKLHDIKLPVGTNGNGAGYPAAPTVGDVDGDGSLEILVQSFGNGFHIYQVPGSGTQCLPWPTARANYLRNAQGPAYHR